MKRLLSSSFLTLVAVLFLTGSQLALGAARPPRVHKAPALTKTHAYSGILKPGTTKPPKPGKGGTVTGSIVQTDQIWECKGPVNLDSVTITMTPAIIGNRRDEDAVHLKPGCTGRIGQINVTQWAGDAIKVAEGVHDLTIGGGSIQCLGKAPGLHQDGVQVMGGARVTFSNLTINCGRANDNLINSNLFIKRAGQSIQPPTDIVCDHCTFGGYTAHTVTVGASVRSGITNSTLCVGKFPKLTLSIGSDAVSPLNSGNTISNC